jgi:hypothetical protein
MGISCIERHEYNKALVYLELAERVLEYCANCGKAIDRFLIISTLRNEAAAYLRLRQFRKTYDYM